MKNLFKSPIAPKKQTGKIPSYIDRCGSAVSVGTDYGTGKDEAIGKKGNASSKGPAVPSGTKCLYEGE